MKSNVLKFTPPNEKFTPGSEEVGDTTPPEAITIRIKLIDDAQESEPPKDKDPGKWASFLAGAAAAWLLT